MRPHVTLVAIFLVARTASASTWIVDQTGSGHSTTIQGAVDMAAAGDEVLIRQGTYAEEVYLDKALTLTGEAGASSTTIDAEDTRQYCVRAADLPGEVVLDGLTFTGVNGGYGFCTGISAIAVPRSASLVDCVVANNTAKFYTVFVGGDLTLLNTDFVGNRARGAACFGSDPDHSVGCARAFTITADNCVFEGNSATDTAVADAVVGTFRSCVFRDNSAGRSGGIFMDSWLGGVFVVSDCLFTDNDTGLFGQPVYGSPYPVTAELTRNTFARNGAMFQWDQVISGGSTFHANVFVNSDVGLTISDPSVAATCNDSWGNTVNWSGFDPGGGQNFSSAPLFCSPLTNDFTVASNSPLLPGGNACGDRVGAFGEGCGAVSIRPDSWARVKARYR